MKYSVLKLCAMLLCAMSVQTVSGQQTFNEMEQLTVNENVTTVITASEREAQGGRS